MGERAGAGRSMATNLSLHHIQGSPKRHEVDIFFRKDLANLGEEGRIDP
jgi:hypothetical protein